MDGDVHRSTRDLHLPVELTGHGGAAENLVTRAMGQKTSLMRLVLALVVCVPGTVLSSQAASAAANSRPPALRGVTTIVGSDTGWAKVRLPRDVDPFGNYEGQVVERPGYDLRGNGRVIGFVLTAERGREELGEGPTLFGWSIGRCMRPACQARGFLTSWVFTRNLPREDGKEILPAGDYRLYLIADGAPVRIRMELAGLKGRGTIAPTRHASAELTSLRPLAAKKGDDTVYWGGTSSALSGSGFALAELWMDGDEVEDGVGSCIYETREPPDGDAAYMPPCPLADVSDVNLVNAQNNEVGYFAWSELPRGMGLWRTASSEPERVGAVTLWLKY